MVACTSVCNNPCRSHVDVSVCPSFEIEKELVPYCCAEQLAACNRKARYTLVFIYYSGSRKDPMVPEWDVLYVGGIHDLLSEMPAVSLQRIKGHQVRPALHHSLSLFAPKTAIGGECADASVSRYHRPFYQTSVLQ